MEKHPNQPRKTAFEEILLKLSAFVCFTAAAIALPALRSATAENPLLYIIPILLFTASLLTVRALAGFRRNLIDPAARLADSARDAANKNLPDEQRPDSDDGIAAATFTLEHLGAKLQDLEDQLADRDSQLKNMRVLKKTMERMNLELNQRLIELYITNEIGNTVNSTLELNEVLRRVAETIHSFLKITDFCIMLYNDDSGFLEVKQSLGVDGALIETARFHPGQGVTGKVFSTGKSIYLPDTAESADFLAYHGLRSNVKTFFSIPLIVRGEPFGVLNVHHAEQAAFSSEDRALLSSVANQIAMAIDNATLFDRHRKLSETDFLTGLFNHGHFQKRLEEEVERSTRYGRPMALLMLDVDRFKRVNDRFGHTRGDLVLREIGRALKHSLRGIDFPARYGGEEFAIILPETNLNEARIVAERLRHTIEEHIFSIGADRSIRITVSIGVAVASERIHDKAELIARADRALYSAKNAGRNRVRI